MAKEFRFLVSEGESDAALSRPLDPYIGHCLRIITYHPRATISFPSELCILFFYILLLCLKFAVFLMVDREENRSEKKKKKSIEVGPWGGNGGTSWDDGSYHGVREITLVFGHCIDWICVVYDKKGKPVAGEKHGGVGGNQQAEIKLQFPNEYLVSVSGYYCPVVYGGSPVIRSLTFKSNKQTFGPFGMEHGTPFSFPVDGGRIVGFKGRSGWYLDSIGFHVSQAQPAKLIQRVHKTFRRLATTAVSKPPLTSKDGEGGDP